jgi:hypothetical protein
VTTIHQVRVEWSGAPGMPGVSTFYCSGTISQFRTDLTTAFTADKSLIPADVTITVPNTGSDIDSGTGQVVGTWTSGDPNTIACTGTGNYSSPVGMVVIWHTGVYLNGRELRGKTFLVPTVASTFSTDGSLNDTDRLGVQNDFNTLAGTTADMVVFSRTAGAIASVTSATVSDRPAVLTTRRP